MIMCVRRRFMCIRMYVSAQISFFTPTDHRVTRSRAITRSLSRGHVITPRPWRNQRDIDRLEFKSGFIDVGSEVSFSRFQPVLVVAIRKIRLVVRATRFISHSRALGDYPRELQHVVKLAGEGERWIGPHSLISEVHVV